MGMIYKIRYLVQYERTLFHRIRSGTAALNLGPGVFDLGPGWVKV